MFLRKSGPLAQPLNEEQSRYAKQMIVVPTWSGGDAAIRPFVAELTLIGTIVAVLLTPFFLPRRSNVPCGIVAMIGTLLALFSLIGNHASGQYFHRLLLADSASLFWKAILLLFVAGVILLWFSASAGSMREGDGAEFFTLLLGATLGMCFVASTSNWLMFAISMEMMSLPSYVLAGFRKTNRLGAEASLKYVLFGAACNAMMIYGISMLYGIGGSLQFDGLANKRERAAAGDRPLRRARRHRIQDCGRAVSFLVPGCVRGRSDRCRHVSLCRIQRRGPHRVAANRNLSANIHLVVSYGPRHRRRVDGLRR